MRILIDECVPRPIRRFLNEHEVQTVQQAGFGGFTNGRLLEIAEGKFELFITSDQNLRYQQNLSGRSLAILMLSSNDWNTIKEHQTAIAMATSMIHPGSSSN